MQRLLTPALADLLKEAATDADARPITYSGRGMHGKDCLAVTGSEGQVYSTQYRFLAGLIEMAQEQGAALDFDETLFCSSSILLDGKTDQMGHEQVLYWPDLEPLPQGGEGEPE